MGVQQGVIVVALTRAELNAVREAIEVTPLFEGRSSARDSVREALRAARIVPLTLDEAVARQLATRIVPVDTDTATARAKLQGALRDPKRAPAA